MSREQLRERELREAQEMNERRERMKDTFVVTRAQLETIVHRSTRDGYCSYGAGDMWEPDFRLEDYIREQKFPPGPRGNDEGFEKVIRKVELMAEELRLAVARADHYADLVSQQINEVRAYKKK